MTKARYISTELRTLLMACLCLIAFAENSRAQEYVNWAASANGGQASASSYMSVYPPSAAIDGNRKGTPCTGADVCAWIDNTAGVYPDRLRVNFDGMKWIYEINVFSLQDSFNSASGPVDPTLDQTFTSYGLVDFEVQYLDSNGIFRTVEDSAGNLIGRVTGNNKVWRKLQVDPVYTSAIRILVSAGPASSPSHYSRIVEVEAWGRGRAPMVLNVPANPAGSKNNNFRLHGTGYSVNLTRSPVTYHVHGSGAYFSHKWSNDLSTILGFYFEQTGPGGLCDWTQPVATWDVKCSSDALGYLWKRVPCSTSAVACQDNDRWNGAPGTYNVTTFPTPGIWPETNTWGTKNFNTILDHAKVNQALPNPPVNPPERINACHPHNTAELATGATNSKAVQVKYADGTTRWFMAFNSMIKFSPTLSNVRGPLDMWRVMWATSDDGRNWTINPQVMFRSISETWQCFEGFLVTDMLVDGNYFYLVMTDVNTDASYLLRSEIDPVRSQDRTGYTIWYVASNPIVNGQYTWKEVPVGGDYLNLGWGSDAYRLMPSRFANPDTIVKYASIGRVFSSSAPNSPSKYIGVTVDEVANGGERQYVQLWSTSSLSRPFTYESRVAFDSSIKPGGHGWEFAFTREVDNVPATPRTVSSGFDFWVVEDLRPNPQSPKFDPRGVTITRHTATISNF